MLNPLISSLSPAFCFICSSVMASEPLQRDTHPDTAIAITGATLVVAPGKEIHNAGLLIQGNKIKAILDKEKLPSSAKVINLNGYTLYPGFIDPFTDYGIKFTAEEFTVEKPVYEYPRTGAKAKNTAIHAEKNWVNFANKDNKTAKKWLSNGFTSVQSSRLNGIFRGRGVTLSLADLPSNQIIYKSHTQHFISFHKGDSVMEYPRSLMGSMALIRQTIADVRWYQSNKNKKNFNLVSEKPVMDQALTNLINPNQHYLFATDNLNDQLRAGHLLNELQLSGALLGNGREYARISELKKLQHPVIIPLNYPKAPNVSDSANENALSLAKMRHWERAPGNAASLSAAGIPFALTLHDIDAKQFLPRLRQAISHGLAKDTALAALTTEAAKIAGISDIAGQLKPGMMADFIVVKGDIFTNGQIHQVWLQGNQHELIPSAITNKTGHYQLMLPNGKAVFLHLETNKQRSEVSSTLTFHNTDTQTPLSPSSIKVTQQAVSGDKFSFSAPLATQAYPGISRFTLWFDHHNHSLHGQMITSHGTKAGITAKRLSHSVHKNIPDTPTEISNLEPVYTGRLTQPNVAFGRQSLPMQQQLHIRNATVWTSSAKGILPNTDVIIEQGKITQIGQQLSTPTGFVQIDAKGKHLTPGFIDEHSHIAINGGINEGSDAISAEVTIGDVINPDDIAIYRSLAGGVTTAQLLHGSANPIGGQAQLIKLRWGGNASGLKFANAPGAIKFALGENVKQSNWGDKYTRRFPQTRMGVEATFRHAFTQAQDYLQRWQTYQTLSPQRQQHQASPKLNYRLQALGEILQNQRDIHIHSYVQSEILMFLKLAQSFNVQVSTFTHVLEGYKVAQELAAHGAGASTFSDWWAYKFEVYDAIPQNTCLMQRQGVLTSINSDDDEMQRRLNQEAAKSMMYCDMSPQDALAMITINPAKQLGIEAQVGSIEIGKQADLVLWDQSPLSVYSKTHSVWVDGRQYFDRKANQQETMALIKERQALIQKILASPQNRLEGETDNRPTEPRWQCDTHYDAWH